MDVMKVWEDIKFGFNPADCQDDSAWKQRVNLSGLLGGGILGGRTLQECVDTYNDDFGGSLECKRDRIVLMPFVQMQEMFRKVIKKIVRFPLSAIFTQTVVVLCICDVCLLAW